MENPRQDSPSGAGIGLNLCRSLHDPVLPAAQAAIRVPSSAQPEAAPAKEARGPRRPRRAPRPTCGNRAPFSASRRGGPRPPGPRHPRSAEVGLLREVFSRQPVGVLVRAALPGMAGLREVEARSELRRRRLPISHNFKRAAAACASRFPRPGAWRARRQPTSRPGGRSRARRPRCPAACRACGADGRPWRRQGPRRGRGFPARGSAAPSRSPRAPRSRCPRRSISRPATGSRARTAPGSDSSAARAAAGRNGSEPNRPRFFSGTGISSDFQRSSQLASRASRAFLAVDPRAEFRADARSTETATRPRAGALSILLNRLHFFSEASVAPGAHQQVDAAAQAPPLGEDFDGVALAVRGGHRPDAVERRRELGAVAEAAHPAAASSSPPPARPRPPSGRTERRTRSSARREESRRLRRRRSSACAAPAFRTNFCSSRPGPGPCSPGAWRNRGRCRPGPAGRSTARPFFRASARGASRRSI